MAYNPSVHRKKYNGTVPLKVESRENVEKGKRGSGGRGGGFQVRGAGKAMHKLLDPSIVTVAKDQSDGWAQGFTVGADQTN